jgi:hypothetical protein
MSALNEVNKVISAVIYNPHRHSFHSTEEEELLTADRKAAWIKEYGVIKIVLCDSLHQRQYAEKLEKMIRL